MNWYTRIDRKAAPNSTKIVPPAYLVERISDLHHAMEVSNTSPSQAKSIIASVALKLREHHNDEYAIALEEAVSVMSDSPTRSKGIISKVIGMMLVAMQVHERKERSNTWRNIPN